MADSKGPWGGNGSGNNGSGPKNPWGGGDKEPPKRPSNQGDSDIDRMIRDSSEHLRRIVGGGGSGRGNGGGTGGASPRGIFGIAILAAAAFWVWQSVYQIEATDRGLVMRFGEHTKTWSEGLHFAPWPIDTVITENVTEQRTEQIGVGTSATGQGTSLMLTSDENIIDVEFEVVWRIKDLPSFAYNLENQRDTIHAVAQSSIREVVARSPLIPLLNTQRDETQIEVKRILQENLDAYNSGIEIVRVNLTKSEPPREVIADFEDVQAAEQERDTLRSRAQAQANRNLAAARGQQAQLLEDAEAYRARVVNEAEGEAARFVSVLTEYEKAPDVTRRRLYLETLQEVYGSVDKVLIDEGGSGVVPYLPLNELRTTNSNGGTQ